MPKLAWASPSAGRRPPPAGCRRPRAAPSAAAIVTNGASRRRSSTERSRAVNPASSTPLRSAPAQKWPPAPVSTTTRTSSPHAVQRGTEGLERGVVDGVAALGAIDGERRRRGRGARCGSRTGTLPPAPRVRRRPGDVDGADATEVRPVRCGPADAPAERAPRDARKHHERTRARVAARPLRPPRVPVLGRQPLDRRRVRRRAHGDRSRRRGSHPPAAPTPSDPTTVIDPT